MYLVDIPQALIDDCMDAGLRIRGWTEEQVYDDLKHRVLNIPRDECTTCPSTAERARLEETLRPDWS